MRVKLLFTVMAALGSIAFTGIMPGAPAALPLQGPLSRSGDSAALPIQVPHQTLHMDSAASSNWAGYAIATAPFQVTDVQAEWTVPTVTCNGGSQASSVWVGIDGLDSRSVEQTGTEQDCIGGQARYYAWYELFPSSPLLLRMAVHPGDQIFAEVRYDGRREFTLTLKNLTTGVSSSQTRIARYAMLTSAEWIVEAPSSHYGVLRLADFGTVNLTQATATIGGTTGAIGQLGSYQAITMATWGGIAKAAPSDLAADNADFSVTWQHQ